MNNNVKIIVNLFFSMIVGGSVSTVNASKQIRDSSPSIVTISQTKKYIDYCETVPCHYVEPINNLAKDKPAFVTVKVYRLHNPGAESENLEELDFTENNEIYVMPNQIVIPAGGVRSVRVYITEKLKRSRDQYFRIRFQPSPVETDSTDSESNRQASSSLFLGFGIGQLLMISRESTAYNTSITIDRTGSPSCLVISNKGNSFVRLEGLRTCYSPTSRLPCQYLSSKHVNAAGIKTFSLEDNVKSIDFDLAEGTSIRRVSYDKNRNEMLKIY